MAQMVLDSKSIMNSPYMSISAFMVSTRTASRTCTSRVDSKYLTINTYAILNQILVIIQRACHRFYVLWKYAILPWTEFHTWFIRQKWLILIGDTQFRCWHCRSRMVPYKMRESATGCSPYTIAVSGLRDWLNHFIRTRIVLKEIRNGMRRILKYRTHFSYCFW